MTLFWNVRAYDVVTDAGQRSVNITLIDAGDTRQTAFDAGKYIYRNGTWQKNNFMYVKANITGAAIDSVYLEWHNSTRAYNLTMTSLGNNQWARNVTDQPEWFGYYFRIFAHTPSGYAPPYTWTYQDYISQWTPPSSKYYKKVGLAKNASGYMSYKICYFNNATYNLRNAAGDINRYLPHEQPLDGGPWDTGLMYSSKQPTENVQRICINYVTLYFDDFITIPSQTIANAYFHVYWRTITNTSIVGFGTNLGRSNTGTKQPNTEFVASNTSRAHVTGLSDFRNYTDFWLSTGYLPLNVTVDSNTINTLAFTMWQDGDLYGAYGNPSIISTPHYSSWIILNLPSNATLQTMDSNSNGISDFEELYVDFTNPFVTTLNATISPSSKNLDVGQSQTFVSNVSGGTSPYSYQWVLNGTPISGATESTHKFTSSNCGHYLLYLNVTDNNGVKAQSPIIIISVSQRPDISDAAKIGIWWQKTVPPAPADIDINGDGIIDISDAAIVGLNWQKHA